MGLDTTHGCWHGAYSAFNRWRTKIASLSGFNLDDMLGHGGVMPWPDDDPLVKLLDHSDCDGSLAWQDCAAIADRLASLMPHLDGSGGGHIGDWKEKTQAFIDGLRLASQDQEDVLFR